MANDLSPFSPEYWSRVIQEFLRKSLVAMVMARTSEQANLKNGDTIHRPYLDDNLFKVNDYTKGTATTAQDMSPTDEYLTIDRIKEVTYYIDAIDEVQNKYNAADEGMRRAIQYLRQEIDGKFLDEISNAFDTVDDGDIGGTAGNPINLSTSNVIKTFSTTKKKLYNNNVEDDRKWYAACSPLVTSVIEQSMTASGFNTADTTLKNGYAGPYMGFNVLMSNNVRHTVSLGIATNPSEGDTVVINGVTFTFNATPSGAGSVDIGAAAANSVDNLVAAINGAAGAGTTYIALSTANRNKLSNQRVVATDNTTSIGLTASGEMSLSETLTAAADGFGVKTCHSFVCRQGATDLVIQRNPVVQRNKAENRTGHTYLLYDLYGIKSFNEGVQRMIDLQTQATASTI